VTLKLFYHPLSSFCWKALIALYETDTVFEPCLVNLGDAESRAELERLWPFNRFPVLYDRAHERTVPESSILIEYIHQRDPQRSTLLPADPALALATRLADRFYDLLVQVPMQKIVGDRLRSEGQKDPVGVEQAKATLATAYRVANRELEGRTWAANEQFSMADCAAAPALFYANRVLPIGGAHPHVSAYLARLEQRPSVARVLREAEPYFKFFPAS
jgi:glutathione S-transferase